MQHRENIFYGIVFIIVSKCAPAYLKNITMPRHHRFTILYERIKCNARSSEKLGLLFPLQFLGNNVFVMVRNVRGGSGTRKVQY